jgi:hypothetical protein
MDVFCLIKTAVSGKKNAVQCKSSVPVLQSSNTNMDKLCKAFLGKKPMHYS